MSPALSLVRGVHKGDEWNGITDRDPKPFSFFCIQQVYRVRMLLRDLQIAGKYIRSHLFTHRPFILTHAVTSRCSCSCQICDTWRHPLTPCEMDLLEVMDMLDQAADAGFAAYVAFGGEPLLRDDIVRILTHARRRGLYTILITNGSLLEEKAAEVAPCTDLTIVSIDDTGVAHDRLRGSEGLFASACAGIAAMRDRHARVVLNCVISRFSPGAERRMLAFARESGLRIAFDPMEHFPGINDAGVMTCNETRRAFSYLAEKRKNGLPILNSVRFLEHQYEPAVYSCAQPRVFLRVAEDGKVRPFWCRKCKGILGDLKTQSLQEIITSLAWKEFAEIARECHACTNSSTVESSLFYSAGFLASRRYIRFAADYAW